MLGARVEAAHEREPGVVDEHALEDVGAVLVVLPADAVAVVAAVGDAEDEAVAAALRTGAHRVDDGRSRVRVLLVDERHVRTLAVEVARLGADGAEGGLARGHGEGVVADLDPAAQGGRAVTIRGRPSS